MYSSQSESHGRASHCHARPASKSSPLPDSSVSTKQELVRRPREQQFMRSTTAGLSVKSRIHMGAPKATRGTAFEAGPSSSEVLALTVRVRFSFFEEPGVRSMTSGLTALSDDAATQPAESFWGGLLDGDDC